MPAAEDGAPPPLPPPLAPSLTAALPSDPPRPVVRRWARPLTTIAGVLAAIAAGILAALAIERASDGAFRDADFWWVGLAVTAGIVAAACAVAAGLYAWRWFRPGGAAAVTDDDGFGATLVGSAPLVIGVAAGVTVVVYIFPVSLVEHEEFWRKWGNYVAIGAGIAAAGLVGSLYAFLRRDDSAPQNTNPRLYGELCGRWTALDARLGQLCAANASLAGLTEEERAVLAVTGAVGCAEATAHRDFMRGELAIAGADGPGRTSAGAKWILGAGFVDLWSRLHDAEEALFVVAPRAQVVANGVFDEGRLVGSNIDNREDLLSKIRWAVTVLGGKKYLTTVTSAPLPATDDDDVTPAGQAQARLVLRDVRHAINTFRDTSREGLTRARNHLMWTGMVTGVVAYALLGLAVLVGADPEAIVAAVAFFLVGAVVGLFDQLRVSSASDTGQEDFGLARARLFYTPVLSGLAAVGGVMVTAMLYATLSGPVLKYSEPTTVPTGTTVAAGDGALTPAATRSAPPSSAPAGAEARDVDLDPPPLRLIFDLDQDRFGLVIAAVFGLTPSLLVERLQGQANRYKADLQSTNAQSHTPGR